MVYDGLGVAGDEADGVGDEGCDASAQASEVGFTWFDRLTMSGMVSWWLGGFAVIGDLGRGVDLAEGFLVGAAEVVGGDVGVDDRVELTAGFVPRALVDGEGGGDVGGGTAQGCGGRGRVVDGDGLVGAVEEFAGFGLMVGEGSHVVTGSFIER